MAQQIREPDKPHKVDPFPMSGNVRIKQGAGYLGIGVSTFWKYVKEGRIRQPMKYGKRVSVWPAEYLRELAENGIPEVSTGEGA